MAQFSNWFISEDARTKALLKYELNLLKGTLRKSLENSTELECCTDKIISLCCSLANKYLDYLQLLEPNITTFLNEPAIAASDWIAHFKQISTFEQKLATSLTL
ncbi:MAG: hypothetical protein ACRCXC_04240 [Legionella sp.]